ncbi:MAG: patatin-like phospholipase family protein [Chloroflexi bacterium]|nr:patatin-like phospholipase family protein [Chloroflexota bacterium]
MKYDLIFEGGGAKGMVLVGAFQEFEQRGHTFDRLLGTSAGAITATLLAAGYSSQEMLAALNEHDKNGLPVFTSFMGEPAAFDKSAIQASALFGLLHNNNSPFVPDFIENRLDNGIVTLLAQQPQLRHLFSFIEHGGWYSAQGFVVWLQRKLNEGLVNGKPRAFSQLSLADFYKATSIDLTLIASDTTDGRMLVLNHRTAPQCPLVAAVRMSMNIPFVWPEVEWEASWGLYRGRDITNHTVVDGGLLSNFPIELFVSGEPDVTAVMGPKQERNVLGCLIDEALPVQGSALPASRGFSLGTLRTVQRIERLIDTAVSGHDKMVIEAFAQLVVRLPAKGYGTTEFNMSDARRLALVTAGQQTMHQYFEALATTATPRGEAPAEDEQVIRMADRAAIRLLAE